MRGLNVSNSSTIWDVSSSSEVFCGNSRLARTIGAVVGLPSAGESTAQTVPRKRNSTTTAINIR